MFASRNVFGDNLRVRDLRCGFIARGDSQNFPEANWSGLNFWLWHYSGSCSEFFPDARAFFSRLLE